MKLETKSNKRMNEEDFIKISKNKFIALIIMGVLLLTLFFGLGYVAGRDLANTPIVINKYSE